MFQYSPNEIRLQDHEKNLDAHQIERIEAQGATDTFRFVVMGDTQRFYAEVEDFVYEINRLPGIDFVVLAGDISDFGLAREFSWVAERLRRLKVPYVSVIGNHDMLANGREVYRQVYGAENFSFSYGSSQFVCLNTNSNEQGYDGSLPDMHWLSKELSATGEYRNVFVVGHMAPFMKVLTRTQNPTMLPCWPVIPRSGCRCMRTSIFIPSPSLMAMAWTTWWWAA